MSGMPPAGGPRGPGFGDFAQEVPLADTSTSDPTVLEIQRILNAFGYGLTESGTVDEYTTEAIKQFQMQHELAITGNADQVVLFDLRRALKVMQQGGAPETTSSQPASHVASPPPSALAPSSTTPPGPAAPWPMWKWALVIGGGLAVVAIGVSLVQSGSLKGFLEPEDDKKRKKKCVVDDGPPGEKAFEAGKPLTAPRSETP